MSCVSSHFLCTECCAVYIASVIGEMNASLPPKCAICRGEIPASQFERQLNNEQLGSYLSYMCMKEVGPNEQLVACTSCKYFEVHFGGEWVVRARAHVSV